jgi:hypothetical protein
MGEQRCSQHIFAGVTAAGANLIEAESTENEPGRHLTGVFVSLKNAAVMMKVS